MWPHLAAGKPGEDGLCLGSLVPRLGSITLEEREDGVGGSPFAVCREDHRLLFRDR